MFRLFSVDDHIIEHARVWADRVPAKYRAAAPHVVEESGREYWEYEGRRQETMGLNAVAGKPQEEWSSEPARFTDMIPGCYDPKARAADFLADGILASVSFPTLPRFGGALFNEFTDRELASVCVEAWNDFVLDEWCPAGPPGLYVPMVIGKIWDPVATAAEIRRCVDKGARAFCFVENPALLGLPSFFSDHWDPMFDACQEANLPICMHIGSSGMTTAQIPSPDGPMTVMIALGALSAFSAVVNLAMSPVCRKFPGLDLVFSEGGIGWIPAALERADRQFLRHRLWTNLDEVLPSEIFRQNMYVCMIEEPIGLKYRDDIGVDRILWEADYPHADTPWPHSQRQVTEVFDGVPDDVVTAITHTNAERLFDWAMASPDLATV